MPEHIRALVAILALSIVTFAFAQRLTSNFINIDDFKRRRNIWLFLTVTAFVCGNFWIYASIMTIYLFSKMKVEKNVVALYLFLLLMLPTGGVFVPGFGLVGYLIQVSHQKMLIFLLLIPLFVQISSTNNEYKFGKLISDKLLLAYVLYTSLLFMRDTTFTDTLRHIFDGFVEVFVPYYVISRYIKNLNQFRDAILSFVIALMIVAVLAVFEYLRSWLLYSSVTGALGISNNTGYLGRQGMLRAVVISGHSIALGFTMVVGIGLFIYCRAFAIKSSVQKTGVWLFIAGVVAALSRGPWMGGLFLWICITLTGKQALQKLFHIFAISVLVILILPLIPAGAKIVNLLPYIGKAESENIGYREQLFTNSMIVIKRNFWTGSPRFNENPEMEAMRTGLGIIDIVNTYLRVTLESGFIGLFLFVGFFTSLLLTTLKTLKKLPDKSSELHFLGRCLFATMCSVLFIITTTSSLGIIPSIYWALAGLIGAYIHVARKHMNGGGFQPQVFKT